MTLTLGTFSFSQLAFSLTGLRIMVFPVNAFERLLDFRPFSGLDVICKIILVSNSHLDWASQINSKTF